MAVIWPLIVSDPDRAIVTGKLELQAPNISVRTMEPPARMEDASGRVHVRPAVRATEVVTVLSYGETATLASPARWMLGEELRS